MTVRSGSLGKHLWVQLQGSLPLFGPGMVSHVALCSRIPPFNPDWLWVHVRGLCLSPFGMLKVLKYLLCRFMGIFFFFLARLLENGYRWWVLRCIRVGLSGCFHTCRSGPRSESRFMFSLHFIRVVLVSHCNFAWHPYVLLSSSTWTASTYTWHWLVCRRAVQVVIKGETCPLICRRTSVGGALSSGGFALSSSFSLLSSPVLSLLLSE